MLQYCSDWTILYSISVQIRDLLEHQEKLYQQKSELQSLLEACKESTVNNGNANNQTALGHAENWAGSFEWDAQADDIRLNIFGIPTYRVNQKEVRIILIVRGLPCLC